MIKAGSSREQSALNVDIAPTLLELARAPIPKEMHGRSLVPVFKANPKRWRDAFLTEYFAEERFPNIAAWQSVRTARWKYVHYTELEGADEGADELYDLRADPEEMKNLIAEPSAQTALKEMKQELQRLLQETK